MPEVLPAAGPGLESDEFYEKVAFGEADTDADLIGAFAQSVEFGQCRFRAARLAGAVLYKVRFTDCVVERSDWSNLRGENGALERVTVSGTRMTGLAFSGGLLKDVAVADSRLDLTNWRSARFDVVSFTGCNLSGADFTNADLRGARFTDCDLTGAQFSGASMRGTRFQRCELAGVGGITSWAGAIVHPDDLIGLSYALAGALGIVVRES
ncbi:pentapeptide repeat-containing protein [Actinoplanes sp. NEAU-A12]|uniref:Pentapeptide repeat-containing protein n=1 Tax=Actinoplanes sandaracinus TaxID=3045177 RepID=A0ABT6WRK2_9ACTN|nr:pentapeptide repeat-containing protein [Actinoplanes sandaracinus]MDI6102329.1 pentapeptide repeat-containing protein [Actinoplanes sandaracinus]